MRKLNYDIAVGQEFTLPRMSWQVAKVAGEYRVEGKVERDVMYYQCVRTDKEYASIVLIEEICLAYLLGEEVPSEINRIYSGKDFQPSWKDNFRYANEDGDNEDNPFWYCGCWGENRIIHCDMFLGEWCFYSLPWD